MLFGGTIHYLLQRLQSTFYEKFKFEYSQDKEEKVSKKVGFSQTKIDFSLLYFGYAVSDFTNF